MTCNKLGLGDWGQLHYMEVSHGETMEHCAFQEKLTLLTCIYFSSSGMAILHDWFNIHV